MKRLLEAVAISCLTAVSALSQSDVRVTGWYDGIAAGDGVTHGSGFKGVAIPSASPRWTKWLPPATPPNFYWQSHIVDDPSLTGSDYCQNGGPSYASNIIPLTSADGETSLYLIGGNSLNANPLAPLIVDNGPLQDPQGIIVRYANGQYDAQPLALYLPNSYILPSVTPGDDGDRLACGKYIRGTGPFSAAMRGPGDQMYFFFGGLEGDQDGGGGPHAIGVAIVPIEWQTTGYGDNSGASHYVSFDFQHHKWNPATSRNYDDLKAAGVHLDIPYPHNNYLDNGWMDCSQSSTFDMVHSDYTPVLARIGWSSFNLGGSPDATRIRFTSMTGYYVDNYFYLFAGHSLGLTFGFRIPYDAAADNGFRRRTDPGHEGAVDLEMWYRDSDHPQGAYHRIDSNRPIAFADDAQPWSKPAVLTPGDNPPVNLANTLLQDTGIDGGHYLNWPAGMFEYPVGSGVYWMTSIAEYDTQPLRIHQLRYDATNAANPWTISTPYQVRYDGTPCTNCTATGNYTLPARYDRSPFTALVYPTSDTAGLGYFNVHVNPCNGGGLGAGGLLPFTFDGIDFTAVFGCTYSVGTVTTTVESTSSSQNVAISSSGGSCGWQVAADVSWMTVTGNSSGVGNGSTTFTIAANNGGSRSGHITIAGRTYTITQAAPVTCTAFGLAPTSMSVSTTAGSQSVTITGSPSGCSGGTWSASSNASWLSESPTGGVGPGTAVVSWTANTAAGRSSSATIAGNAFTVSQAAGASPNPPTNVKATTVSTTSVQVSWSASSSAGVTGYYVYSSTDGSPFQQVTPSAVQSPWTQTNMQPSLAYRYKVLAWNGSLSPDSNTTLATTIVFDDPVLVRNLTPIRAIHVVQLRQAVDSVRHAAGLSPGTYTDAALCQTLTSQHQCVGPVAVKHGHVQDLRDQLQNALVLLQIPQPTYSDSPLTQGVIIKKQHIEELRAVVGTPSQ